MKANRLYFLNAHHELINRFEILVGEEAIVRERLYSRAYASKRAELRRELREMQFELRNIWEKLENLSRYERTIDARQFAARERSATIATAYERLNEAKRDPVSEALGEFYAEWGRKIECVIDTTKPVAERLAALHWIDAETGDELTPESDLERVADELRREMPTAD